MSLGAPELGPMEDIIVTVALLYLALPVAVFLVFWFRLPLAALSAAALGYALFKCGALRFRQLSLPQSSSRRVCIVVFCAVVACAWTLLSVPSSQSIPYADLAKHEAILHDLSTYAWPVTFFREISGPTLLRYSFAYYLIPAGLSHIFGVVNGHIFLYIWTALGVFIFLIYAASIARNYVFAYVTVLIVVLFSGLNIIYWVFQGVSFAAFSSNVLDAWSREFGCGWLIGSNAFSLRWSPQHTVAAFLASIMLRHYWNRPQFISRATLGFAVLILWSPFVALSFCVLAAANVLRRSVILNKDEIFARSTIFAAVVALFLLLFVLADPQGIPSGLCVGKEPFGTLVLEYLAFTVIEFGIFAVLAILCRREITWLQLASLALLSVLPFFQIGAANDFQMRGSEVPMCILTFFVVEALQVRGRNVSRVALSVAVGAGAVCGGQELLRGATTLIPPTSWNKPIFDVDWDGSRPGMSYRVITQYIAHIRAGSLLANLLRDRQASFGFGPTFDIANNTYWNTFGTANFNKKTRAVSSSSLVDAALYGRDMLLKPGLYRVEAVMDWDAHGDTIDGLEEAAHLSIFSRRKLVNIRNSAAINQKVTIFTNISEGPTRFSFGLGGWSHGTGYVRLRSLQVTHVFLCTEQPCREQ
ncbi:MAG: hypothetical protein M3O74_11745 [Pseudomonadota bacterium]|nr:hypothetical protein [Pseudomonadota bacterium]